ncbi:transcriptional repressor general negative regulator of transcription subunit 4 [Aspergillus tubingensis]
MPALPYLCRLVLFLGVYWHALFLSVSACVVGRGSFALFLSSASLTHRLADVKKLTALLVDEEFPPLGAQPKDKRPVDSFGYLVRSHFSSDSQSSARAGTPTLPPGLPLPHAHPASALFQSPLNPSSPVSSPSVPPGLNPPFHRLGTPGQGLQEGSRQASPDLKDTPDNVPTSSRVKNASEISLGSPVPKSANKARAQQKGDLTVAADKKAGPSKAGDNNEKTSAPTGKVKPIKLELPLGTSQSHDAPKPDTPSQTHAHGPVPTSTIGSRPNTPLTGVSRVSDSSAPRQPRVLRVVDTPKTETPPPPSATQSVASIPAATKARSRRPSISSLSRPDTPGDLGSEADLYTSASVSRANSPPASSRIGSAPVRAMTKSQAKKERRQKAKELEAKKQEATAVVEEPVQAPIIGRKRKTKKTPVSSNDSPAAAPDNTETGKSANSAGSDSNEKAGQRTEAAKKNKSNEKATKDSKATVTEEKATVEQKAPAEAWRSKNTVEQLMKDAESSGVPVKELFAERTSPLQVLLAQLHKSAELDLNNHPLFNPANLNQRFDMKCNADDYDILKQPIELTDEHRKALMRGEAIRVNSDSNMLKDRCLISPRGCVLHHLSPEEEERYLALEKNIAWAIDTFQEYSNVPITEPDVTNRAGGLDALFATPENFNICWVDETSAGLTSGSPTAGMSLSDASGSTIPAPPNVLSAMEADSTRSHNWAIANTAELVNATATSVRSFAAATAKHMLGAAGVVMGNIPDLDDVVGMTNEELRSFAVKSQKDLESSRKELDTIDKKLNALVKRNRKLAQQALATTVDA